MIRIYVRRTRDVEYLATDRAGELDEWREGPPGRWWRGRGDPHDPRDAARALTSTDRAGVVGYDVVIAAPRPISILMAVDRTSGAGVVAAHQRAARAAMDYLDDHAVVVRRQRAGERREEGAHWSDIVSYTHGVNRHGEPHLHDHVLVGARPSGSSVVLDSRSLFAHAVAADALYRASLRHEVAVRTPWTAWRSFGGVEHVMGLDEGYRALWGGHHHDRGAKLHWSSEDARRAWRDDLARFAAHGTVLAPPLTRRFDEHAYAAAFEGRANVTRRDVVAAWSDATVFGQDAVALSRGVDLLYPTLRDSRGLQAPGLGVADARLTGVVRDHGPRPLEYDDLERWRYRSRERSRDGAERSR
ncbi:MAG: relaxase domain-containing protein [Acidimicrobiales bacterium]